MRSYVVSVREDNGTNHNSSCEHTIITVRDQNKKLIFSLIDLRRDETVGTRQNNTKNGKWIANDLNILRSMAKKEKLHRLKSTARQRKGIISRDTKLNTYLATHLWEIDSMHMVMFSDSSESVNRLLNTWDLRK